MEDIIVSKVGRHTQQLAGNQYEAEKNVRDIVATIQTLARPDYKYIIQRLSEGARRETSNASSPIHNLNWYFGKEVEIYQKISTVIDQENMKKFIGTILTQSRSADIEYWMLHSMRKGKSLKKFKSDFMLDEKNYSALLKRWRSILEINEDDVKITSKQIQGYYDSLKTEQVSYYAKHLTYSGKMPSNT